MKKSRPATLKLEPKKLLGFRIQTVDQASGAEHTLKISSKAGGKPGGKAGAKFGLKGN